MPFDTRFRCLRLPSARALTALLSVLLLCTAARAQQLSLQGIRSQAGLGQFNGLKADAAGNLYTLLDAKDGVRLLKFDPTGSQLLGQTQFGQQGDQGVALALDAAGNVYIVGTSLSTSSVTGTPGTAFPARADSTENSFLARFTPALTQQWLTFLGSGKMAVAGVDTSASQVVVTGGVFSATLPVTSNGIQQAPLPGSTGDGFVQAYSTATGSLVYSTYLTGANGDTQPSSVVLDASGNAYIAGTTSATGFPTINALVPAILSDNSNPVSGFLAKFTPAGDAILFSTYIPGNGIFSEAFDPATNSLLLSGDIARGLFPVSVVSGPIASNAPYQTAIRIALDGSAVTSSTLLAPANISAITATANGFAATATEQNTPNLPLLPVAAAQTIGNAMLLQADSNGVPQRAARIGGLPVKNSGFASLPALTTGIVSAADGSATAAGGLAPTLSATLLTTERYDFAQVNSPNSALPSTVRDALPSATCAGSECAGGAGLLARISTSTSPLLAFSIDGLPNIVLRNTGATDATGVQVSATGYTLQTTCASTVPAGGECDIFLNGNGPGTITVGSGNAATTTQNLPALTGFVPFVQGVVVTPKELDFGSDSAVSAPRTRTLTITNLSGSPQTFVSKLTGLAQSYTVSESGSDCIPVGDNVSKSLAANATCHINLSLAASADPTNDGAITAAWTIGNREVALTGYVQAAALSVSATHIGFGQQYNGGLRVPRYLYLSNGSDLPQTHTALALPPSSPFSLTDNCPSTIAPQSVCKIALGYNSLVYPSSDSTTLTLDGSLTVTVDGQTLPAPSVTGASTNPSLSVSPTSITFVNPVVVTTVSTETETVGVKNTGAVDFALSTAVSGDFTATACPATLTAGSTCTITLNFTPSDSGTRQGLLSVTAGSDSPVYVTLSGQGTPIVATSNPSFINGSIGFGEVPVGTPATQWFKIGKPFQSLTVASSSPNYGVLIVEDQGYGHGQPDRSAFKQTETGSCANCYVGVQFLPIQPGPLPASLAFTSTAGGSPQTTALNGIGVPATGVLLSPSTASFGSVAVGSSTPATVFVLTNATGGPLTTGSPSAGGDFSISTTPTGGTACGGTLADGASCVTGVQFAPSVTGNRAGQLTIPTGSAAASAALSGTGTISPGISFQPNSFIFNNVPGAQATTQSTTVTNTGSTPATIGAPTSSDSHFTAATNCATLAPGANCSVTVTYAPTPALASGLLTLPVTTSTGGNPQTASYQLPMLGQYTQESAGIQIVPGEISTVNFGAIATGAVSGVRVLQVNNLSGKSLAMSVQAARQFPVLATSCGALAPAASCTISVVFAPLTNGDITGTLFVQATATDGSGTLNGLGYLEGYGLAANSLQASGSFSPTGVLDFGQVGSGQSSTQVVTLTNRGGAAGGAASGATSLTIRRIHADFPFLSTSNCGATLAVNATCTVGITFAPSYQTSTGTTTAGLEASTGVVTVETDAENAPFLIEVAGRAAPVQTDNPTNVPPLSVLALSQGALTFASTPVGTASPAQPVVLANAGTTTVHVLGILTSPDFTATGTCATLNPGDSCTLQVSFTPQSSGTRSSGLELQTDAAESLEFVSLLGTGSPASVSLAPSTLTFGSLLLGRSGTQTATFTNTGATPVTLGALAVTGDYAITPSPAACTGGSVLAPSAACTIAVTFSPTQTGTRSGTLSVASSATALPLAVSLTGIGAQPQLTATPNGLSFGDVQVGKSAQLSLTLTNSTVTDVNALSFAITGDFNATSTCGPVTLPARSSCAITVTFSPTLAGPRTGTLTITSSDPSSPLTVPLTGNGIQGGSFTLTANGASVASATVVYGLPATYNLAVTPIGGFTGAVALTCTPQGAYSYVACSITPSTVTLTNGTQTSIATITTVTAVAPATELNRQPTLSNRVTAIVACLFAPCVLLVRRRRLLRVPLLLLLCSVVLASASGCGGGIGDQRIRYAAPGNYQFTITASSTTGITVSQSATLNLTITNPNQ